jgi:hypothetical protein
MEATGAGGREALLQFVRELPEDLGFVFDVSAEQGYLHPEVAERLWPAWEALRQRGEFENLETAVAEADFDVLARAGLMGPELEFKLAGVRTARDAARRLTAPED